MMECNNEFFSPIMNFPHHFFRWLAIVPRDWQFYLITPSWKWCLLKPGEIMFRWGFKRKIFISTFVEKRKGYSKMSLMYLFRDQVNCNASCDVIDSEWSYIITWMKCIWALSFREQSKAKVKTSSMLRFRQKNFINLFEDWVNFFLELSALFLQSFLTKQEPTRKP